MIKKDLQNNYIKRKRKLLKEKNGNDGNPIIMEKKYADYQIDWMIKHKYTIDDMVSSLADYCGNKKPLEVFKEGEEYGMWKHSLYMTYPEWLEKHDLEDSDLNVRRYHKYQLYFLKNHHWSLKQFLEKICDYLLKEEYTDYFIILAEFDNWQTEEGFTNSEIWPCYYEWLDCEEGEK